MDRKLREDGEFYGWMQVGETIKVAFRKQMFKMSSFSNCSTAGLCVLQFQITVLWRKKF